MKHTSEYSRMLLRMGVILLMIVSLVTCSGRPDTDVSLDHIILAINNLDSGVNQIKRLTGIEPTYGGAHPDSYTHNALFSVGQGTYIEILAPRNDLDSVPDYFKKFDRLTPIGWAISSSNIEVTKQTLEANGFKIGEITPGSRIAASGENLQWKTCVLLDSANESVAPFFINWNASTNHPSESSAKGCELKALKIRATDVSAFDRLRNSLNLSDARLVAEQSDGDNLSVTLKTPNGEVVITGKRL